MFAGKSTEVQRQGKRYEIARNNVLYIKPSIDVRYSLNELVTHDGQRVEALRVEADQVIVVLKDLVNDYDVFVFDEVQFFNKKVIEMIKALLVLNKTVICGGLDMDFSGEPFPITAHLMAMAEEVTKLHAVCDHCGENAYVSHRLGKQRAKVVVGNDYKPLCRKCYNKPKKLLSI